MEIKDQCFADNIFVHFAVIIWNAGLVNSFEDKISCKMKFAEQTNITNDVKILQWRHVAYGIPYCAVVTIQGNVIGLWNLCRKWRHILYSLQCTTELWWIQIWSEFGESGAVNRWQYERPYSTVQTTAPYLFTGGSVVHFLGGVWGQKLLKDSV